MRSLRVQCVVLVLVVTLIACQLGNGPTSESRERMESTAAAVAAPPVENPAELARQVFDLARAGDHVALAGLVRPGFPLEMRNGRGDTLLILAAYYGHADVAALLIERGARVDGANDQGNTPLMGACFKGDARVVDVLLRHGATIEATNDAGQTGLMFAALFDQSDVAARLVQAGADRIARISLAVRPGCSRRVKERSMRSPR